MEYVVVDTEGSSRGSFPTLSDARDWAHRLQQVDPDLLEELLIERYRRDGAKAGRSEWADDFLRGLNESMVPFEPGDGRPVVLRADLPRVWVGAHARQWSWSGTVLSRSDVSFHSRGAATETPYRLRADMQECSTEILHSEVL